MRLHRILCFILCMMLPFTQALAMVEELSGNVVAGYETSITAPFGGTVSTVDVREGKWVNEGDQLGTVKTTRVVSPADGVVRGIYVEEGDSLSGTVLTVAPESKYTVTATIEKAYTSVETKYVELGETVYIRCHIDGSHQAMGRITAVQGSSFTVETISGELYMEETVNIFRSPDYDSESRIGQGTVGRTSEIAVTGTGSLVRMHVENGETVERGQILFETVEGSLSAMTAVGNAILAENAGVITSVTLTPGMKLQKGATIATYCPRDGFELSVTVPEDLISYVHVGDTMSFELTWNERDPMQYVGQVVETSYIGTTAADGTAVFTAILSFDADESVRIGMSAVVKLEY